MSTLVPPPLRTPIQAQNGAMHPVWERWFISLFDRVGNTQSFTMDEVETAIAMSIAPSAVQEQDESSAFDPIGRGGADINEDYSSSQTPQISESIESAFPVHENSHSGWQDLLADISAGRAIGVNAPTWAALNGGISAYSFSASTMNEIWMNIHIPHDYEWGTPIYPHVHWTTTGTNAGVCRWGIEYTFARGYGVQSFPATSTIYIEQAASGVALRHMIAEPAEGSGIVLANCEPDAILMCRVFRDAAHPNDTLTDAAFGIFADMHYMSDGFLTNERNRTFTKRRD